jgi:RNA polymerase subunit RPABC4/transcription elongation factor Spt4
MAEDFGKKVERFGQDVWKKTTDTFGVIGKNAEIASKSRELRTVYAEIGRQYCSKHAQETGNEFPDLCAQAYEMATEIAALEEQVLRQRGLRKCANCGESISRKAAFCPHCGEKQPEEEPIDGDNETVEPDGWVCPACGTAMAQDDQFCSSCGTKRP